MYKPTTIGIIGCGVIGPIHAESFLRLPDVKIAWACDLDKSKADALGDKFGIAGRTTDYRTVLDDKEIDLIAICTDHASHAPIAIDALAAGKHVLCEKALGATTADLDAMIVAQKKYPDLVFSGILQHRFDTINRCLKHLIDDGVFGTMLSCTVRLDCWRSNDYYKADAWRGTWAQEGGSALINQAIHYIDIGAWLMGGATQVSGIWSNRAHEGVIECEDTAVANLQFVNGALGSVVATTANKARNWHNLLIITGTEGTVELRDNSLAAVDFESPEMAARVRAELESCVETERAFPGKSYYGTRHPTQIANVIAAIQEGRKPFVTAQDARHCVDIVLGIYESQRSLQTISLK